MATRKPLVQKDGVTEEIPPTDTIPVGNLPMIPQNKIEGTLPTADMTIALCIALS